MICAVSVTRSGAKRNPRQPELTLLPYGSGVFSCPLDVGIPQAKPKATRQFRLRRSCLSRMVGAEAGSNQATRFASLNREFAGRLNAVLLQAEPQSSRLCLALRAHRRLARMFGHSGKGANRKARGVCLGLSVGSPCWARTSDNLINSQVLSHSMRFAPKKRPYNLCTKVQVTGDYSYSTAHYCSAIFNAMIIAH